MTENGPNDLGPGATPPGSAPDVSPGRHTGVLIAMAAVIVALVVVIVVLLVRSDDAAAPGTETTVVPTTEPGTDTTAPPTTVPETTTTPTTEPAPDTTAAPETTTTPTTSPTTTAPAPPDPGPLDRAVWPGPDSSLRFTDPVETARSFAVDFVGFEDPIVGEFRQGDSRSGEIDVRPNENSTPTTVFLRQLSDDDTWWVISAMSENLIVDVPEPGATIGSPLVMSGRSVAWEGTVEVSIRADDTEEPLFEDFFTGMGAPGDPAPFEVSFDWDAPASGLGSIVVFTSDGALTGQILEATVVRVAFGG